MKERDSFDKWYKTKAETGKEFPPDEIWENISNKLDIEAVWENVDSQLHHIEEKKKRRKVFVYFIFITVTFLTSYLLLTEFYPKSSKVTHQHIENKHLALRSSLNKSNSITKESLYKDKEITASQEKNSLSKNKKANFSKQPKFTNYKNILHEKKHEVVPEKNKAELNNVSSKDSASESFNALLVEAIDDKDSLFPIYLPSMTIHLENISNDVTLKLNSDTANYQYQLNIKPQLEGFYIGTLVSGQNTWLLNTKTFNSISRNSINHTIPKFTSAFGITLGYYKTSKWSLQSNFIYDSEYGQGYGGYKEGEYMQKHISLHYYQINLYTVKRIESLLKNKNIMLTSGPLAGFNFKYLNRATMKTNRENISINDQYSKYDFGLLLGYEYCLVIKTKYVLFSSVTGDLGLYNIYSGNPDIPKEFNKTFNSSLSLGFGLRYLIKKTH